MHMAKPHTAATDQNPPVKTKPSQQVMHLTLPITPPPQNKTITAGLASGTAPGGPHHRPGRGDCQRDPAEVGHVRQDRPERARGKNNSNS